MPKRGKIKPLQWCFYAIVCQTSGILLNSLIKHFLMFGEILLDKFLVWMGQIRRDDVVFESPRVFDAINTSRRGGIIIVSHLGNTEVCSALAHQLPDIHLTLLVYTQHAEKFNSLMKKVSGSARIEMLQVLPGSSTRLMAAQVVITHHRKQ